MAKILNETSFSRIFAHIEGKEPTCIGIISAFVDRTEMSVNRENSDSLKWNIKNAGYGYFRIIGHFTNKKGEKDWEEAFFIIGGKRSDKELKRLLITLGKDFTQDSIIFKPKDSHRAILIGTKDGAYPGLNVEKDIGTWHPDKIGEYYSTIRGKHGKPFIFERQSPLPGNLMSLGYALRALHEGQITEDELYGYPSR